METSSSFGQSKTERERDRQRERERERDREREASETQRHRETKGDLPLKGAISTPNHLALAVPLTILPLPFVPNPLISSTSLGASNRHFAVAALAIIFPVTDINQPKRGMVPCALAVPQRTPDLSLPCPVLVSMASVRRSNNHVPIV